MSHPHPTLLVSLSIHIPFTGPLTLLARCELTNTCTIRHRARSALDGTAPEAHQTAPRRKRTIRHRVRSAPDGTAPEAHQTAPRQKCTRRHRAGSAPYGTASEAHHTAPRQKRTRRHRAGSAPYDTALQNTACFKNMANTMQKKGKVDRAKLYLTF